MDKSDHPIVWRKIEELTLWEDNPRTISKVELDRLKRSLERDPDFMEAMPIVLSDRTGKLVIISGNQRYKGCKALGWKEVPTVLFHCQTEEEEVRKAMIANHNNGEWDTDILTNKFAEYPLDEWLGSDWEKMAGSFAEVSPEIEEDAAPEVDEKNPPITKPGDVYLLGEHKLMCGDSTKPEDMEKLTGGGMTIDLWLTDPPYNVAYVGKTKDALTIANDNRGDTEFREFLADAYRTAAGVMKPGAAFYIFHASSEGYNFRGACRDAGLEEKQELIWNKDSLVIGRQDYQWKHEPALYGWKPGASHHWYGDRKQTTVLDFDRPKRSEQHPTMKPVALFAYCMKNSTKPGDAVLDSFGGSGTTLIAAEQLGRRAFLMELDPKYCDVIVKRWEQFTGEKAKKISGQDEA